MHVAKAISSIFYTTYILGVTHHSSHLLLGASYHLEPLTTWSHKPPEATRSPGTTPRPVLIPSDTPQCMLWNLPRNSPTVLHLSLPQNLYHLFAYPTGDIPTYFTLWSCTYMHPANLGSPHGGQVMCHSFGDWGTQWSNQKGMWLATLCGYCPSFMCTYWSSFCCPFNDFSLSPLIFPFVPRLKHAPTLYSFVCLRALCFLNCLTLLV